MNTSLRHRSKKSRALSRLSWIAVNTALIFLVMVVAPLHPSAAAYETDDMILSINAVGRVDGLSLKRDEQDPQVIYFYNDSPTGGFYIRDNSISSDPSASRIPAGCTNLLSAPTLGPGTIGDLGGSEEWDRFLSGSTEIVIATVPSTSNYAARVKVEEEYSGSYGHYGGICQVLGPSVLEIPDPDEYELYYLSFEVKTRSGWRAKGRLDGHTANEDDLYGHHRISAFVEWSDEAISETESPNLSPQIDLGNQFYAYGTSESAVGTHLTRFCGRSYRPRGANYARIVLLVEGFMPLDRSEPSEASEVYLDNVYFFKEPRIIQVAGDDLFTSGTGSVPLYRIRDRHVAQSGNGHCRTGGKRRLHSNRWHVDQHP